MNSLTIENFSMGFYKLVACFEFNYDDHYLQMVYDALKDQINDQMFLETCSDILKTISKKEWNEAYGFKGRPALVDWLKAFIPKKIDKRVYENCPITGARLAKNISVYPEYYQDFLDSKKPKKLN